MNKPHYNKGNNNQLAFVFSAPGQAEEKNAKPVSGQTGNNLETVLNFIQKDLNLEFRDRYDFTITNALTGVLYGKRTEATITEILKKDNIERLESELKDITGHIIFFGKKAQSTMLYLTELRAKFITAPHLGLQSINQIKHQLYRNEYFKEMEEFSDTKKRLYIVSQLIKHQL